MTGADTWPQEFQNIAFRLLEEGVPPSVISRALDLSPELVKRAQSEVRVKRYGTDDMTEYMEQLQWDAVDEARQTIATGSAAEKSRVLGMVLGKQVALSARRTPESVRQSQDAVLDMLENMRAGKPEKKPIRSRFVATLTNGSDAGT